MAVNADEYLPAELSEEEWRLGIHGVALMQTHRYNGVAEFARTLPGGVVGVAFNAFDENKVFVHEAGVDIV